MFGSVLVPIKALVLNVLSLSATFGALVWIFQDGHLAGLLDFTPTGTIAASTPILMFCIAFGLSMDYEVFLLSRIKEEHDRTGDNTRSVADRPRAHRPHRHRRRRAHQRRVHRLRDVAACRSSSCSASGCARRAHGRVRDPGHPRAGVHALAGEANWWAPKSLRRLYDRIGISETEEPEPDARPSNDRRAGGITMTGHAAPRRSARSRSRRGEGEPLRDEILAAAERLIVETGNEDAVSIRAIADAVGVTPPSIYLHFPDKDPLILAVCERHFETFDALIEEAGRRPTTRSRACAAAVRRTSASVSSTPSRTASCS